MKKQLIAGNWKMNGSSESNAALVTALTAGAASAQCLVAVCVPAPYLAQVQLLVAGSRIDLGAQDVSQHASGAFTGEVSAAMLREFATRYCLVGHSERRQYHGETDAVVASKAQRALAAGITPIVCVGETLAEREAGRTEEVVKRQLAAVIHTNGHCISEIVVAYDRVAHPNGDDPMAATVEASLELFRVPVPPVSAALRGAAPPTRLAPPPFSGP